MGQFFANIDRVITVQQYIQQSVQSISIVNNLAKKNQSMPYINLSSSNKKIPDWRNKVHHCLLDWKAHDEGVV